MCNVRIGKELFQLNVIVSSLIKFDKRLNFLCNLTHHIVEKLNRLAENTSCAISNMPRRSPKWTSMFKMITFLMAVSETDMPLDVVIFQVGLSIPMIPG